jgi:hypothetical protein
MADENLEDSPRSPTPACGGCPWAQGFIQCPKPRHRGERAQATRQLHRRVGAAELAAVESRSVVVVTDADRTLLRLEAFHRVVGPGNIGQALRSCLFGEVAAVRMS